MYQTFFNLLFRGNSKNIEICPWTTQSIWQLKYLNQVWTINKPELEIILEEVCCFYYVHTYIMRLLFLFVYNFCYLFTKGIPEDVRTVFGFLMDSRPLSVMEYDKLIKYLVKKREDMLKNEYGDNIPANLITPPIGKNFRIIKIKIGLLTMST